MLNGGVTQIQAELGLLTCATDRREYAYYHLLSGMDLPLKSQTDIHSFFENNSGKNFVNFSGMKKTKERNTTGFQRCMMLYHTRNLER